uniref:PKD/Chitinase domain-containing protein n=1 Tax=Oncorhynchus tshawytscha TaxID=74940 RepID=A0A8C8LV97_ONCTS
MDSSGFFSRLTITDSAGLSDSTMATVKVIQSVSNGAPVAIVGPNRQLTLPVTSVTLDGSSSTDDHVVTSYHWDTIRGHPGSRTQGVDKPIAIVTSLRAGRYTFSLTVSDQEGLKDSALLTGFKRVRKHRSLPPVAHASGSHTRALPNNSLVLRGSVTDGDPATVDFLWVWDSQSPAAGDVLYGSEQQASLYLANLVEGTYLFQLRVTDTQGRSSTATATMEVRPDPGGREEVEVEMLVALAQVSVSQKDTVLRQLAALLQVLDNGIHLRGLWGHSDISTVLRFSVQGPEGPVPGPKLAILLQSQLLREKTEYLLFRVLRVDTVSEYHNTEHHILPYHTILYQSLLQYTTFTVPVLSLFCLAEWQVLYFIMYFFMVVVFIVTVTWTCVYCVYCYTQQCPI